MAQFGKFPGVVTAPTPVASAVDRGMFADMTTATQPTPATTLETMIQQMIVEVIKQIDWEQLCEPQLAYRLEDVVRIAGFKNELAVIREIKTGRLIGAKVRDKWVVRRERLQEYLREQEVTV